MKALVVIPARNEMDALPGVLRDVRRSLPDFDVLVVDDASTDETPELLERLRVPWLRLPIHLGVGGAVRAGLQWARMHRYDAVVRLDADGQHPASEVLSLLAPLSTGIDAVQGSRFLETTGYHASFVRRLAQRLISALLSRMTGRRVSDPTSGFWAFGPRALRLLAEHYPTGYSEPELTLLLSREKLRVLEIPVEMRQRQAGRTTLTPHVAMGALARTFLAMVVVPLRSDEDDRGD